MSRPSFRHMNASNWPSKMWPSACSRRLESYECAEDSILFGLGCSIWAGKAMIVDPINGVANALALAGKSSPNGTAPASFGIWVYKYPFWDNPMIGSACPADDISPPRYRQIHPFQRPDRILRADGAPERPQA